VTSRDVIQIGEVFSLVMELALLVAKRPLPDHYEACWEREVDDAWWVSLNPHPRPRLNSHGISVPSYHLAIEWLGWPAGVVGPQGGEIAAGDLANEDTLIEALKAAISKAREGA